MEKIKEIFKKAYDESRKNLTEIEVYEIFKILGLDVPKYFYIKKDGNIEKFLNDISYIKTPRIVLKIISSINFHKTDLGGVKVVENSYNKLKEASIELLKFNDIDGIMGVEFISHSPFSLGEELLLGARSDDAYGPIIALGPGGTHTESFVKTLNKEFGVSFMPVLSVKDDRDISSFIDGCWILNYCFGKVRGLKPLIDKSEVSKWISRVSDLMKRFNDSSNDFAIEEVEINPLALSNRKLYSLDGVLRFRKSKKFKRNIPSRDSIRSIVDPASIAVIGVSEKKINMARIILNNTIKAGFSQDKIFVIKDGVKEIDGVKAYPNINSLPFKIDMCVVAVSVDNVIDVLKEVRDSGKVNGVVLITGGIGEKSGSENIATNLISIIEEAREKNQSFALNGGNCMGIVLNRAKVNTFFIPEYKMKYPLGKNPNMAKTAFVSQSGAFVISTLTRIPHIIPDYTITVGNQQDITVVDYLDYFVDSDIEVILSYIEGFKYEDGIRLIDIIKRAKEKGKTVVLYKAGRTSLGQKAVMGHTASIAGDYLVSEKLLSLAGAIVCDNFDEFCDMSFLSTYLAKKNLSRETFMVSNAGFETTGMADNIKILNAKAPSQSLKSKVDEILKKHKLDSLVDFKNPMDITPMAGDEAISDIIESILKSCEYQNLLVSMVPLTPSMNTLPQSSNYPDKLEKSFLNKVSLMIKETKKSVIFCVASGSLYDPYVDYAIEKGFVVFRDADRMVRSFEKYISFRGKV